MFLGEVYGASVRLSQVIGKTANDLVAVAIAFFVYLHLAFEQKHKVRGLFALAIYNLIFAEVLNLKIA